MSHFNIELPSKCLLYPNVDPLNIKIRAFTGGDEAVLSEITPNNAVYKVAEVLGNTLSGINVNDLTLGDKLFLLVWHAINSYADGFTAKIVCESCLEKVDIPYNLKDVKIEALSDKIKEPYELELSKGEVVSVRLFRVKDELQMDRFERENNKQMAFLLSVALSVVDPDKDVVARAEWLRTLPSKDVAKIRAFQDSFYHGPDFEMPYTCPKCKGGGTFTVPFRLQQFFPTGSSLTKSFGIEV